MNVQISGAAAQSSRGGAEGDVAGPHDATAAEALADRAGDELQRRERHHVGGDRSGDEADAGAEALGDVRDERDEHRPAEGAEEPARVQRQRCAARSPRRSRLRAARFSPLAAWLPSPET